MTVNRKGDINLYNLEQFSFNGIFLAEDEPKIIPRLLIILKLIKEEIKVNCKEDIQITLKISRTDDDLYLNIFSMEDSCILEHIFCDFNPTPTFKFLLFDLKQRNPFLLFNETIEMMMAKNKDISYFVTQEEYSNLYDVLFKFKEIFNFDFDIKKYLNDSTANSNYLISMNSFIIHNDYRKAYLVSVAEKDRKGPIFKMKVDFEKKEFSLTILGNKIKTSLDEFLELKEDELEDYIVSLFRFKKIHLNNLSDLKSYLSVQEIIQYD